MENTNQPQNESIFSNSKTPLPNATAVLVLGICSIVFSCFYIGLILGIIGLVMSGKGRRLYKESPSMYDGYGQLNAGWILSLIGTILSGIFILWVIIWLVIYGTAAFSVWSNMN